MQENVNTLKGLSFFDSTLSAIDKVVSDSEYKEQLISLLQPILDKTFPGNSGKQKIRIYNSRLSFACPYCMDSQKSNYKKRGNFILSGKYIHYFKCHNCGISKRIDYFFKDYHINLDLSTINYISNGLEDFSSHVNVKYDMSMFFDMNIIDKYTIDRQEFLKYFGLIEVKNSSIWSWLKNRLQYDNNKFLYDPRQNYITILNLTQSGKILGFQKRFFKKENNYFTYKLTKLYELMNKNPKEIPDEIDVISQIFNICLIDYSKPVTLFEGPFDSFLFKNSIANTGANKNFPLDIETRFFYDDDPTGRDKSIEKINEGSEVFLWQKLKYDYDMPHRTKWDLNDCLIYFKEKNIKTPNFNNYFSKDSLDIIDI